jgi:proline iminopeptidase
MRIDSRIIGLTLRRHSFSVAVFFVALVGIGFSHDSGNEAVKTEEGLIRVNETELYFKVMGNGTPIVIVHGGPGLDHTYFLPQFNTLAKEHRLIFYDQRASGRSTSLVDTNSMTMDNFVEDLEGIRKAFGIQKLNLLGHSWGGLVAMFYALKYPENLNSLVLVNSTPASVALRNASFGAMAQRTSTSDSIVQSALVRTEGFRMRDPATMAKFFRLLFRGSFYNPSLADSLTLTFDSSYATKSKLIQYLSRDSALTSYDLFPRLKTIHCPTLIVGSDHDMVTPEANELLHESIPGSTLVVLKHCGHFPYVEEPGQFFGALGSFLNKARE